MIGGQTTLTDICGTANGLMVSKKPFFHFDRILIDYVAFILRLLSLAPAFSKLAIGWVFYYDEVSVIKKDFPLFWIRNF